MALPTNPTQDSIVTEALNRAGESGPSATRITRAKDIWLEEVKNSIWRAAFKDGNTRLKTLQTFDIQISVLGKSKYDFPSDFNEEITVEVLDGEHTGTAQTGAASSITLESGEDITEDVIKGQYVLLTGGTGVNGLEQCITYNESTLEAGVAVSWTTEPVNGSTYLIVNDFTDLEEGNITELNEAAGRIIRGKPTEFYKIHEDVNVRFILDRPPDKSTYGIRVRYYANLNKVDLVEGSTLISRIYSEWEDVLIQGVLAKVYEDNNDDRYRNALGEFKNMIVSLLIKEIPYGGEFTGFTLER